MPCINKLGIRKTACYNLLLLFLAYFPYFEKLNGTYDIALLSVRLSVCLCIPLYIPVFVRRLVRSPCCLCTPIFDAVLAVSKSISSSQNLLILSLYSL
jgi:hypothetical protein